MMWGCTEALLRPSATPVARLQLSLPLLPLAAPVSNLRLASAALPPARPWANPPARIGVVPPGSVGGKYSAFAAYYALPIDWLLTFQLALASCFQLGPRLLPTHIWRHPSARLVSNFRFAPVVVATSACAFCCCDLWLAPTAARLPIRW
jgi:hypothetical protein